MASKVPKFGAWEGGENYTVYFDNARQKKNNGQMINPNDPQENPDMDVQIDTQTTVESQGEQSKVPQFGAWDNGDNVGYTVYFENARNTKTTRPSKSEDSKAQAQAQAHMAKADPQDARSKVPQFGDWNEGEGGAQYTAYFENARKNKNDGSGDVADRARPKARSGEQVAHGGVDSRPSEQRGPKEEGSETPLRQGRQTPGGQAPQQPKGGNKPQLKPTSRGSQNSEKGAAIPQFGVWNTDPQAEGFTGAFKKSREERMTPLNKNTPASYEQQSDQPKKGCCCPWFS